MVGWWWGVFDVADCRPLWAVDVGVGCWVGLGRVGALGPSPGPRAKGIASKMAILAQDMINLWRSGGHLLAEQRRLNAVRWAFGAWRCFQQRRRHYWTRRAPASESKVPSQDSPRVVPSDSASPGLGGPLARPATRAPPPTARSRVAVDSTSLKAPPRLGVRGGSWGALGGDQGGVRGVLGGSSGVLGRPGGVLGGRRGVLGPHPRSPPPPVYPPPRPHHLGFRSLFGGVHLGTHGI